MSTSSDPTVTSVDLALSPRLTACHALLHSRMLSAALLVNGIRRLFSAAMAPAREKFNVVFVLGGPGAGKGTQCARIVEVSGRSC